MIVNCSAMGYPKQRKECIHLLGVIHFVAYKLTSTWVFPGLITYYTLHVGLRDEFSLVPANSSSICTVSSLHRTGM